MDFVYFLVGVAVAGWLAAFIGLYRVMEATGVLYQGMSDYMRPRAERELMQAQSKRKFSEAFRSPRHRLDRWLVICGTVLFIGVIAVVSIAASLAPTCLHASQSWCVSRL